MNKYCIHCGNKIEENDKICGNCGKTLNNDTISTTNVINKNKTDEFAICGFILSIVSIISCGLTPIIGLIFSIIGLVNCNKKDNDGKGFAIAGIIISSVMIIFLIILCIFLFAIAYSVDLY